MLTVHWVVRVAPICLETAVALALIELAVRVPKYFPGVLVNLPLDGRFVRLELLPKGRSPEFVPDCQDISPRAFHSENLWIADARIYRLVVTGERNTMLTGTGSTHDGSKRLKAGPLNSSDRYPSDMLSP